MYLFLTRPALSSHHPMSSQGGVSLLLTRHLLHQHLSCIRTLSSAHMGVTCLCSSILMFLAFPLPSAVRALLLRPSLALATPSVLLLPPYPCRRQNVSYCDLQMFLHYCLSPPRRLELPSSLIACLPHAYIKNRP